MGRRARKWALILLAAVIAAVALFASSGITQAEDEYSMYKLPALPPPPLYGNILINRVSSKSGVEPVAFSHWMHRMMYTCRVCHEELEFSMKTGMTEITEEKNLKGEYCGACHNGRDAFGHTEKNCKRCHNNNIRYGSKLYSSLRKLPDDQFGNRIDWHAALKRKMILPKRSIFDDKFEPMTFDRKFEVKSILTMVPPAVFSHKEHLEWLDCSNCHPDIFTIKKDATQNFSMDAILAGRFCGACHLSVAFPIQDCKRCHPGIGRSNK